MRLKKSTAWFTARTSETGMTSFICGVPLKDLNQRKFRRETSELRTVEKRRQRDSEVKEAVKSKS